MSSINEYQKARGYRPVHPDMEKDFETPEAPPQVAKPLVPAQEPFWTPERKNLALGFGGAALLFSALFGGQYLPSIPNPYDYLPAQEPQVVERVVEVPVPTEKIVYKYIKSEPEIIYKYIKDPAYDTKLAELRANYERRLQLIEAFKRPLAPGEVRKLTFETNCPGQTPQYTEKVLQ